MSKAKAAKKASGLGKRTPKSQPQPPPRVKGRELMEDVEEQDEVEQEEAQEVVEEEDEGEQDDVDQKGAVEEEEEEEGSQDTDEVKGASPGANRIGSYGDDDEDDDDSSSSDESDAGGRPDLGRRRGGARQAPSAPLPVVKYDGTYKNKQRVLVFCSRGVTARYRHLLEDLRKLIPHHKKDVKLDCKGDLQVINEIAEIKSCNNCIFLEARKRQDLYLWLSKTPFGPSARFLVQNVHTMDELKLTGNAMLGSRPFLSFDTAFETHPHLQLVRAMLVDAFGTPRGHPRSKPFVDRVMAFMYADGKIWVRNYQIADESDMGKLESLAQKKGDELTSLIEIGPRFVLNPIRIFSGSFGGPTLYQNPAYVSPNLARSEKKRAMGVRLANRLADAEERKVKRANTQLPPDELAEMFKR